MRVLVITRNAWDDTNSIGNTMSNFFPGQQDIELANLYFRASKPNNSVCTRYFHVTETDILRHLFSPEKCGRAFDYQPYEAKEPAVSSEKKMISMIHRFSLKPAYLLSDRLWNSRKWINGKLKRFVEEFRPDVVFTFAKSLPQYYWTVRYLYEECHVRIALWIADDEYSALSAGKKKRDKRQIERLRTVLSCASVVWGCSAEICEYYNRVFGCHATPLYKSCTFDYPVRKTVNRPVRIVYAGNLLFSRADILKKAVRALSDFNAGAQRAILEIYSGTPLGAAERKELEIKGISSFCGARSYSDIRQILAQADVVLHIESFAQEEILKTKYSFSTKIIDCLESGSVLLAIGPAEISSIQYIKSIPGAFVIENEADIQRGLSDALEDSDSYPQRAEKIREFAREHHSPDPGWLNALTK